MPGIFIAAERACAAILRISCADILRRRQHKLPLIYSNGGIPSSLSVALECGRSHVERGF